MMYLLVVHLLSVTLLHVQLLSTPEVDLKMDILVDDFHLFNHVVVRECSTSRILSCKNGPTSKTNN